MCGSGGGCDTKEILEGVVVYESSWQVPLSPSVGEGVPKGARFSEKVREAGDTLREGTSCAAAAGPITANQ